MAGINLRVGEEIALAVRAHPIKLATSLFLCAVLLIAPFFFMAPLFALGRPGLAAFFVLIALGLFLAGRKYALWRGTVFVVTNQRVIDLDRRGFFRRIVSEVNFDNITDISFEIAGLWQTVFHAGDVLISTRSGSHSIEAQFISEPHVVREAIAEAMAGRRATAVAPKGGATKAGGLEPEDERAVLRYTDHLKQRRATKEFFDGGSEVKS